MDQNTNGTPPGNGVVWLKTMGRACTLAATTASGDVTGTRAAIATMNRESLDWLLAALAWIGCGLSEMIARDYPDKAGQSLAHTLREAYPASQHRVIDTAGHWVLNGRAPSDYCCDDCYRALALACTEIAARAMYLLAGDNWAEAAARWRALGRGYAGPDWDVPAPSPVPAAETIPV
ncbi:MAG TPA: hypothetical protein VGG75_05720 [Trebonia sp.]|jgi:hypothetical protein